MLLRSTTLLVLTACFALTAYGQAEPNGVAGGLADDDLVRAVDQIILAQQVARYGQFYEDPLSLISAAKILMNTSYQALEAQKTPGFTTGVVLDDPPVEEALDLSPEALLEAAARLAGTDDGLQALIDQLRAAIRPQGQLGHVKMQQACVQATATDAFELAFKGAEVAIIHLSGNRSSNLDLFVYDEHDNVIGQDLDPTDEGRIIWTPARTGPFTIKILNLGETPNCYVFVTN